MVFGLVTLLVSELGSVDTAKQAGNMVPFLGVVILSLVMVVAIPFIVPMISGNIQAGWAAAAVGGGARRMMPQPRPQLSSLSSLNATSDTSRKMNAGADPVRSSTSATDPRPASGTGAKMQRMMDRAERLSEGKMRK